MDLQRKGDVLCQGEGVEEGPVLVEDPYAAVVGVPLRFGETVHLFPLKEEATFSKGEKPEKGLEKSRFATAASAEDDRHLSRGNGEREVPKDRRRVSVPDRDVVTFEERGLFHVRSRGETRRYNPAG